MPELSNPFGAMGGAKSWAGQDTEFKAGGTITPNKVVVLGVDGSVTVPTTSPVTALVVGVALNNATAGETVRVRTHGLVYTTGDASITAGKAVVASTAVAGNVVAASAATGTQGTVGVAVQTTGADVVGYTSGAALTLVFVNPSVTRIS